MRLKSVRVARAINSILDLLLNIVFLNNGIVFDTSKVKCSQKVSGDMQFFLQIGKILEVQY